MSVPLSGSGVAISRPSVRPAGSLVRLISIGAPLAFTSAARPAKPIAHRE